MNEDKALNIAIAFMVAFVAGILILFILLIVEVAQRSPLESCLVHADTTEEVEVCKEKERVKDDSN